MAYKLPTIPDDKIHFYRKKLTREVSNLFKWENLPNEIPDDYLENVLITAGSAMFFYDRNAYGYMVLECGTSGFNIYRQPTTAYAVAPNDENLPINYNKTIVYNYNEELEIDDTCVLINNMYQGESLRDIIEHYAYRLALIQQAFDTNAIWQNIPVVFTVDDQTVKLSLEKFFGDIFTGQPWVIVDKQLLGKENGTQADPITIPYILDKLADAKNVIYNEFKATLGIDNIEVDKKERLIVGEMDSNKQHTKTCLDIMLSQREKACKELNRVFGLNVSIIVAGGDESGTSDDGVATLDGYGEL